MKRKILTILLAVSLMIPPMPVMASEIRTGEVTVSETEGISEVIQEETKETESPEDISDETPAPEETQSPEEEMPDAEETPDESPEATKEPAATPSAQVQAAITPEPTAAPDITSEPTATPEPTAAPTATAEPAATPSASPTAEPDDDLVGDVPELISQERGSEVGPAYQGWYSKEELNAQSSSESDDELLAALEVAPVYSSDVDAVAFVKANLKARNTRIVYAINYDSSFTMTDFLNAAMLERSDTPADEGDYLLANVIGWKWVATKYSNGYILYETEVVYTDNAQMEAETTTAINQALTALNLSGKSEYEKIKAIHDYVVDRIDYTNDDTYKCHSTYAAIVEGKAVCQGYASLFLRMCKQSGIPARYITGTGNGEAHAWNIVKMGDYWYNVDTTWDDPIMVRALYYDYFLKSDADFEDHVRSQEYMTSSFYEEHPMSPVSYRTVETLNEENITASFDGIDGDTLSTQSDGKPKIIVFFRTTCGNSRATLSGFSRSSWISDGKVDVYAIDVDGKTAEEVAAFEETYCPEGYIKFGYGNYYSVSRVWNEYLNMTGADGGTLPFIAMIDTDNKVQFVTTGIVSSSAMEQTYLPALDSSRDTPAADEKKPVTTVRIRYYESASHVDMDLYYDLVNGSTRAMNVGDYIYLKGVGVGADSYQMVDSTTRAAVSDLNVIKYDAASRALRAVGPGKASITFTSVSNPEVSAKLNITVKYNNPEGTIPFGDVMYNPGNWQYEAVKYASDRGIMTGVNAEEFQPKASLTRAQFASVLYRLAGSPAVSFEAVFSDVPAGTWYSDAVIWAYRQGIVAGLGNGRYGVNENITREQIARMLMEYARVMGYDISAREGLESFADQASVSGWAYEYVCWMVGSGMMSGTVKDGKYYLNPRGNAARDECASMLMRFIQKYE